MVLVRDAVGQVLRDRRVEQGRTLRDVAHRAACGLGYLSEIERGRKEASSEVLAAVADALDLPVPDLLTRAARHVALRTPAPATPAATAHPLPASPSPVHLLSLMDVGARDTTAQPAA